MDTNVIGRKANDKAAAVDEWPKVKSIFVRSLTEKTKGNGCGIGIAEYCHQRVLDSIDMDVTRINCITSAHPSAGAIPLTYGADRDALCDALAQVNPDRPEGVRCLWIRDTLTLGVLACSESFLAEAERREDLQVLDAPHDLGFDGEGNLREFDALLS